MREGTVEHFSEPEDGVYEDMLALMKGMADISIDYWGVNYERSKLVDFSYPDYYTGIHIYSGTRKDFIHANLIMGVFDAISYWFMIAALIAMAIICFIFLAKDDRKNALPNSILYVSGNAFKQGLSDLILPRTLLGRFVMTLFSFYNYVICLMYGSVIISLLIGGSQPPAINLLEDLNRAENMNKRIILGKQSHVYEFLKSANMLSGFEHRIDLLDFSELYEPTVIHKILEGSHVVIMSEGSFDDILCTINANGTIANLDDFQTSRYIQT